MNHTVSARLKPDELASIRRNVAILAPEADAYLFGSRTNPAARGGDIDLLVLTEKRLEQSTVRNLRRAILNEIGEQKLDIVNFARSANHPFKDLAMAACAKI